jgi:hypothetical protein
MIAAMRSSFGATLCWQDTLQAGLHVLALALHAIPFELGSKSHVQPCSRTNWQSDAYKVSFCFLK